MSRVERNSEILRVLLSVPERDRYKLLKVIQKTFIDTLRDCCRSFLLKEIPVSLRDYAALKPYKHKLRIVTNPKVSCQKARKVFQTGGFLEALTPVLTQLI